jgi:hypothetical protein
MSMSHFYGVVQGRKLGARSSGESTRCGTKSSGLETYAASWNGAVRVSLHHDEKSGEDKYVIEEVRWQGNGRYRKIAEGIIGKDDKKENRTTVHSEKRSEKGTAKGKGA